MKINNSYSSEKINKQFSRLKLIALMPGLVTAILLPAIYISNSINKNTSALVDSWNFSNVTSAGNAGGKDISSFTTFQEASPGRLSFVTSPVAPGHQFSARVETQQNDVPSTTACCRAEFMDWRRAGSLPNQVGIVVPNSDYYYSFSYYLPANFTPTTLPNPSGVGAHYHMQQFHAYAGAVGYGPDLSIELTPGTSAWRLNYLNKQLNGSSPPNYGADISHITLSNSLNLGKWSNIIVHYRPATGLSGSPASNGLVEAWYWVQGDSIPSQPIKSVVGANMRNDGTNNVSQTLQHGMYRAPNDGAGTMVHYTEGFIRSTTFADALKFYSNTTTTGGGGTSTGGSSTGGGTTSGGSTGTTGGTTSGGTPTGGTTSGQTPYLTAISIPGKLEVENYDKGGEGVAYHDTTTANQGGKYRTDGVDIEDNRVGGYSVGYVASGEWMSYTTNIAETGKYDITFRVATGCTTASTWSLKQGSSTLATATTTNTGGWYAWKDITIKDVNLTAGNNQIFKLEPAGCALNIDYLNFLKQGAPVVNNPGNSDSPSLPSTPPPPVEIPNANPTTPVSIPTDLPKQSDGTLIADFNGDGLNDVAKDTNNDNKIDPKTEIIIDGKNNKELTDTTKAPITASQYNDILYPSDPLSQSSSSGDGNITLKAGPLPEVKVSKKMAYGFIAYQGIGIVGLAGYILMTRLSLFTVIKSRLGF